MELTFTNSIWQEKGHKKQGLGLLGSGQECISMREREREREREMGEVGGGGGGGEQRLRGIPPVTASFAQ